MKTKEKVMEKQKMELQRKVDKGDQKIAALKKKEKENSDVLKEYSNRE